MKTKKLKAQGKEKSGNLHITITKDILQCSGFFTLCHILYLQINFNKAQTSTNKNFKN